MQASSTLRAKGVPSTVPSLSVTARFADNLSGTVEAAAAPFHAVCDGRADASAAINAAIAFASTGEYAVQIPQGTCRITRPLVFSTASGKFPHMRGHGVGSTILADYSAWQGTDYNAIEIVVPASNPVLDVQGERIFSDFQVIGEHNSKLPTTVGIAILDTAPNLSAGGTEQNYAPYRLRMSNVAVRQFDTCYNINDAVESSFENIAGNACRVGINGIGYLVNDTFHNLKFNFGSNDWTSNKGDTTGFNLGSKWYPCSLCPGGTDLQVPQGIIISDSHILNFGTDITVGSSIWVDIHDNVLDFAKTGATVRVAGSNWLTIHDNYIYTENEYNPAVGVSPPGGVSTALWIKDNFIIGNNKRSQAGISFGAGKGYWQGVHVAGNHFTHLQLPVYVAQDLKNGEISRNTGSENTGTFIDTSAARLGGFIVDQNRTSDPYPPYGYGNASQVSVQIGENVSASTATPAQYGVDVHAEDVFSRGTYTVGSSTGYTGQCKPPALPVFQGGIVTGCK